MLFAVFQAFSWRVLLADPLNGLLQLLLNLLNRFLLHFEVSAGPDKVYEEQDDSAVMMAACFSGHLRYFLILLRAEVIFHLLNILLVARRDRGEQVYDSIRILFDGAELVVEFGSQLKDLLADSFIAHNLVELLFGEGFIVVGHPLLNSELILFDFINYGCFLDVGDEVIYSGESLGFDFIVDFALKLFDSVVIIKLLWVDLLHYLDNRALFLGSLALL